MTGNGTTLISLYIPSSKKISDVVNYLKQEKATSKNIKSDHVRHEVESNLDRVIQRLKYHKVGGMVLYSGNDSLYEVVGEFPWYYRCSKTFQIQILTNTLDSMTEVIGVISMDLVDCAFSISPNVTLSLKNITSGIPSKHRAGGQSSQRFKHLREEAKRNWFKRIADYARFYFMDSQRVERIIIHGESFTKREFLKSGVLEYRLQKIAELSDGCYAGEDGLYELRNNL